MRQALSPKRRFGKATISSESGRDVLQRSADETDRDFRVAIPFDAPIVHLVDAADASNEVKFKAEAELSKSVN